MGTIKKNKKKLGYQPISGYPEVNFNKELNGDLHFDFEVDLHGFLKVEFVF